MWITDLDLDWFWIEKIERAQEIQVCSLDYRLVCNLHRVICTIEIQNLNVTLSIDFIIGLDDEYVWNLPCKTWTEKDVCKTISFLENLNFMNWCDIKIFPIFQNIMLSIISLLKTKISIWCLIWTDFELNK